MKVNGITKDFNLKVQALLNDGHEPEELIQKLEWNATPFSLVRNSKRNVPPEKYDLFVKLFGIETQQHQKVVETAKGDEIRHLETKYVQRLEDDVQHLQHHNKVLRTDIERLMNSALDNQYVILSLIEKLVEFLSNHVIEGDDKARAEFRSSLYKEATELWKVHKKKGSFAVIDSDHTTV